MDELVEIVQTLKRKREFEEEMKKQRDRDAQLARGRNQMPFFNKKNFAASNRVLLTDACRRIMFTNFSAMTKDPHCLKPEEYLSNLNVAEARHVIDGLTLIHKHDDHLKRILSHVITLHEYDAYQVILDPTDDVDRTLETRIHEKAVDSSTKELKRITRWLQRTRSSSFFQNLPDVPAGSQRRGRVSRGSILTSISVGLTENECPDDDKSSTKSRRLPRIRKRSTKLGLLTGLSGFSTLHEDKESKLQEDTGKPHKPLNHNICCFYLFKGLVEASYAKSKKSSETINTFVPGQKYIHTPGDYLGLVNVGNPTENAIAPPEYMMTLEPTILLRIDGYRLNRFLDENYKKVFKDVSEMFVLFENIFVHMRIDERERLLKKTKIQEYKPNSVVIVQGEVNSDVFFITRGRCSVTKTFFLNTREMKFSIMTLEKGDHFGANCVNCDADTHFQFTITTLTYTTCARIPGSFISRRLGDIVRNTARLLKINPTISDAKLTVNNYELWNDYKSEMITNVLKHFKGNLLIDDTAKGARSKFAHSLLNSETSNNIAYKRDLIGREDYIDRELETFSDIIKNEQIRASQCLSYTNLRLRYINHQRRLLKD